jgi:DNA-binding IclR family transcriptional regulator
VHAAPAPVSVKAIAAGVGLKLGTTYHLVNTLLAEGYLVRNGDRSIAPGRIPGSDAPQAPQDTSRRRSRAPTAPATSPSTRTRCRTCSPPAA